MADQTPSSFSCLGKAKFLVKGLRARLSTQKLLKEVHLFNAATSLQDGMTISAALLAIHRVLFEERVEHVKRKDLGVEVAVVTSIIATNEVADPSMAVTPFPTFMSVNCFI
jgi:hypothetical protein